MPAGADLDLVWRGIRGANPWWTTGKVPEERTRPFRRHAFAAIHDALTGAERGRGVVVLGPRRVGKTVLLHQMVDQLLADGVPPDQIAMVSLDDVALREADLGEVLGVLERRKPLSDQEVRYLLLDEVQHSPDWSGWLKRLADRRDPARFLATGSSATALRRGGQDAGLGRWREMVLYPWSFREHVHFRKRRLWTFDLLDHALSSVDDGKAVESAILRAHVELHPRPADEDERLEDELVDYLVRGGFPEVYDRKDLREAQRHLRQDILDRALGRDVVDVVGLDTRALERMFLRICKNPGGLWNASDVGSDLGLSRPTVAKYLDLLERAFLVFKLPNLASPIKGQTRVYLVSPALRSALLGLNEDDVRTPSEWGCLVENLVAATAMGTRPDALQIGFWRQGKDECDVVVHTPDGSSEFIEVKRSGRKAISGLRAAARALQATGRGYILTRRDPEVAGVAAEPDGSQLVGVHHLTAAGWLYQARAQAGGTLRIDV